MLASFAEKIAEQQQSRPPVAESLIVRARTRDAGEVREQFAKMLPGVAMVADQPLRDAENELAHFFEVHRTRTRHLIV